MFKRIDHVEIIPADVERSLRFYQDVLGFQLSSRIPVPKPPMREVIYLRLGDTMLEIVSLEQPAPASASPRQVGICALALEVDSMTEAIAYLHTKGISMSVQPVDLGDSWRGELRDPDGIVIELRQWKKLD